MSLCTCIRAALFASVAAPLLWAIQAFAQEEAAALTFCNQLFDTFDSMNGPLDDVDDLRTRIRTMATILNSSSSNPDECWFSYKVRANYAHMLQLDGRMHLSIEQNRQAVRLALKYNPADILTPAFNLATSLQTWSFGDPLLMKEANRTWKILSHLHDRSLRIRAATHLPNMLPSRPVLRAAITWPKQSRFLHQDKNLDCEF